MARPIQKIAKKVAKKIAKKTAPVIALVWAVAACSSGNGETVVFAASSLAPVTSDIDAALESGGDIPPEWVLAGSSRLIAQVRDGARPDVIISADASQLAGILHLGYVVAAEARLANRIVLAVADGNPAQINSLDDLSKQGPLIGLCAPEVPCGRAAQRIAMEFGVAMRPDTDEPNVRALAHKLANGELDAGLVYATDAQHLGLQTISDTRLADPDDCSHPAVVSYGIAVLASGAAAVNPNSAVSVDRYLPPEVLEQAGFDLELCR